MDKPRENLRENPRCKKGHIGPCTCVTETPRTIAETLMNDWCRGELPDLHAACVEIGYAAAQAEVNRAINETSHADTVLELRDRLYERMQKLELERTR